MSDKKKTRPLTLPPFGYRLTAGEWQGLRDALGKDPSQHMRLTFPPQHIEVKQVGADIVFVVAIKVPATVFKRKSFLHVVHHDEALRRNGLDPKDPTNRALTPLARDVADAVASITLPVIIHRDAVNMDTLPKFDDPAEAADAEDQAQ